MFNKLVLFMSGMIIEYWSQVLRALLAKKVYIK